MPETLETTESTVTSIDDHLDRLLAFEATTLPVISLYLNAQSGADGRVHFEQFIRKELVGRARTFTSSTPERASFDADVERIQKYLDENVNPSANGIAIFACSGAGLFEALQLNTPLEDHYIYVYHQPHLYHLARLEEGHPRYAALLTDANSARIFVFGLGETLETEQVKGKKVNRVKVGGWSQARYQRRVEKAHNEHAKEIVDVLERLVREEKIRDIVIAGDVQITTVLQEQMPKHLQDKIVDVLRLDLKSSDQDIFKATLDVMRQQDAMTDADKTGRLFREYRARGLAVIGPQATLEALANGQVDELLLSANLEQIHGEEQPVDAIIAPEIPDSAGGTDSDEPRSVLLADLLVTKAKQTDARVTFIEDASLLEAAEGVGAFLRWRN